MRADLGREAVYAAEIAAFDGTSHESITDYDELAALARSVTTAAWWPHGPTQVVRARSDASSSSTRQRGQDHPVIRLAAPQMTPATVIHELAHVLAGVGTGHGAEFRRAHVDLVGFALGETEAGWLLEAYASVGLAPGRRTWAEPPVRRPGAIAL
jgi:putative metallohydrolase (TIGR04338 family)